MERGSAEEPWIERGNANGNARRQCKEAMQGGNEADNREEQYKGNRERQ